MAVAKITKQLVESPEIPESGHLLTWDSSPGMGGFGIRVSPTGRVAFLVRFWTGTRERWKTLGSYPRMNLTKARKEATKILRAASEGADPVEDERKAKVEKRLAEAQTVASLATLWLDVLPNKTTRRGRRISPRTVEQYTTAINKYIVPRLGKRPVSQVTRRDVQALHSSITKKGYTSMANGVVAVLGIFFNWLAENEYLPAGFTNPAHRPPRNPEPRRGEHAAVRLSRDQEARLVRAIYKLIDGTLELTDKNGKKRKHSDPVGGVALLSLLDTGRRLREVLGMEWRRLDLEAQTVDLGATKGKIAGDVCYLPRRVCDAIKGLPRIVGNPYVFTGHGEDGRRWGLQSAWRLVKTEAGLEQLSPDLKGFRIHDLRHHRISEMLAAGIAPQLVARQVGHTSLEQLKIYSHLEVQDVAAVLSRLEPVEPAAGGEVVEMEAAR